MRKNDLEAAPAPCRSRWSCTGPVHLQDGIRTRGPLGTGLLLTTSLQSAWHCLQPCGMMLQCQEIVLRSWFHQEDVQQHSFKKQKYTQKKRPKNRHKPQEQSAHCHRNRFNVMAARQLCPVGWCPSGNLGKIIRF